MSVRDGGVLIVLFLVLERLLCDEDRMDLDNYVIIVEFGMLNMENCRNGDGECMQLSRLLDTIKSISLNLHLGSSYFRISRFRENLENIKLVKIRP